MVAASHFLDSSSGESRAAAQSQLPPGAYGTSATGRRYRVMAHNEDDY